MSFEFFTSTQYWHFYQLCAPIYLQFSSLFGPTDASKCEIRNQREYEDYIRRFHTLLDNLIFDGTAKMKLTVLTFLLCREFVKNSVDKSHTNDLPSVMLSAIILSKCHNTNTNHKPHEFRDMGEIY